MCSPQWGTAYAEVKDPSVGNSELKVSPFKAWVSIETCMLRVLPGISSLLISTLMVHSRAFFPKSLQVFLLLAVTNTSSGVGPQNKTAHPASCYRRFKHITMLNTHRISPSSIP